MIDTLVICKIYRLSCHHELQKKSTAVRRLQIIPYNNSPENSGLLLILEHEEG